MSVEEESDFLFDFGAARKSVRHDKPSPGDGNTFWPGVDFRVFEQGRELWIEVKNWRFKETRDPARRNWARRDFQGKFTKAVTADAFRDDVVAKFLGTTSYLAWSGIGIPEHVTYVVFLEPPNPGSRPLLLAFRDRLRDEFKHINHLSWGGRIEVRVVDLLEFHRLFPQYPVKRV